jgi:hypothetical protein
MNIDIFQAEAYKLSKPCCLLKKHGSGDPFAYWHTNSGGPCISFLNKDKWLTVSRTPNGPSIEVSSRPLKSAVPLFAEQHISLPPIDAVFLLGSDIIGQYLSENDWSRNDPFNDNFPDQAPQEYISKWQNSCPMYLSGVSAVLGGWHMPWPDGDFEELISADLMICTYEDAEPWIELFNKNGDVLIYERFT